MEEWDEAPMAPPARVALDDHAAWLEVTDGHLRDPSDLPPSVRRPQGVPEAAEASSSATPARPVDAISLGMSRAPPAPEAVELAAPDVAPSAPEPMRQWGLGDAPMDAVALPARDINDALG
jgi:hypothetical protein